MIGQTNIGLCSKIPIEESALTRISGLEGCSISGGTTGLSGDVKALIFSEDVKLYALAEGGELSSYSGDQAAGLAFALEL